MLQFPLTIFIVLPFSCHLVHGLLDDQCNIYDTRNKFCGKFEICDETTNTCLCAPGYNKVDDYCLKTEETPSDKSISNSESINNQSSSAFLSIFMFLFASINVIIIVFVVHKFKIINWARNKINSYRRSNYDEFMIGQDIDDDPPLR